MVSAAIAALSLISALLTASLYDGYARREAGLIPDALVPRHTADEPAAAELATRFPRDPRSYLYQAAALQKAADPSGAEQALRTGLAQTDALDNNMPPATRTALTAALAEVLATEGRTDEAQKLAVPICTDRSPRGRPLRGELMQAHLCA